MNNIGNNINFSFRKNVWVSIGANVGANVENNVSKFVSYNIWNKVTNKTIVHTHFNFLNLSTKTTNLIKKQIKNQVYE